jgi:radical SAM superfamily enzyme YgiQ (UPF0313 family)
VHGQKPELFDELLKKIVDKKPDIVAFSIVYSSQAFYAYALLKELKDIVTVIGGPAVNEKLVGIAGKSMANEIELLEFVEGKKIEHDKLTCNFSLDYSIYNLHDYFTPKPVIPLKATSTCYYKKCTFCTHFSSIPYFEYPLETIKETIIQCRQKYFFLIDDMIPVKRLLELAALFKPLHINWTCQLRPTKELDYQTLKRLKDSGLMMIMWGIESGNDRILQLINKGTNIHDIASVLNDSHKAGIRNIAYIIIGFPTETKKEFLDTIGFLKTNNKSIDLVSVSVFGLQKGTFIYNNPEKFGIKIIEEERTVLEPKIRYEVKSGLTLTAVSRLRNGYKRTFEKINKFPKTMNFFREHMFCLLS